MLVSHIAKWYLLPDKTSIVVPSFHIANEIFEVRNSGPHVLPTRLISDTGKCIQLVR